MGEREGGERGREGRERVGERGGEMGGREKTVPKNMHEKITQF